MTSIHPTAIVEPGAQVGPGVAVGPFCHIGGAVRLGDRVRLGSHVVIGGRTTLGAGCEIFPFACIGLHPQDKKYAGEESELVIGKANVIREHVTIHPGTAGGGLVTRIGDGCLLMASTHVAHDCRIGNEVVMANHATLGGHVEVQDFAVLGGLTAVHQHVRVGAYAMVGGMSGLESDVIPYGLAVGNRATLIGLNTIGMKRRGIPREEIRLLRNVYATLFAGAGAFADRLTEVSEVYADQPRALEIVDFIRQARHRSICRAEATTAAEPVA